MSITKQLLLYTLLQQSICDGFESTNNSLRFTQAGAWIHITPTLPNSGYNSCNVLEDNCGKEQKQEHNADVLSNLYYFG